MLLQNNTYIISKNIRKDESEYCKSEAKMKYIIDNDIEQTIISKNILK